MSSSLTNSGSDTILSNQIIPNTSKTEFHISDIVKYFSLIPLSKWIACRNFKHVVIQVPDEFIEYAASIVEFLQNEMSHFQDTNVTNNKSTANSINISNLSEKASKIERKDLSNLQNDIEDFSNESMHGNQSKNDNNHDYHGDSISQSSRSDTNLNQTSSTSNDSVHLSVMADTSYGSCCVDEITASKVNADCIIHLGSRKCLSFISSKVALVNIPGDNEQFSVDQCWKELKDFASKGKEQVIVLYELQFWRRIVEELVPRIQEANLQDRIQIAIVNENKVIQNDPLAVQTYNEKEMTTTIPSNLVTNNVCTNKDNCQNSSSSDSITCCQAQKNSYQKFNLDNIEASSNTIFGPFSSEIIVNQEMLGNLHNRVHEINGLRFSMVEDQSYKFFYVGKESNHFSQIMLEYNESEFTRYDGIKNTFDDAQGVFSKIRTMVRRRYFLTEKAKNVNTFGILISTVTIKNYMDIVKRIQSLLRDNDKQFYIFFVGKVNVPKLANFSEIEMYILVSCGQNSVIDTKEFFTPIITPFELEVAFGNQLPWEGKIITEFENLLSSVEELPSNEHKKTEDEEPRFSIITGSYMGTNVVDSTTSLDDGDKSLVKANDTYDLVAHSNAVAYFHEKRTFRGLEQNIGQTPVVDAEVGLSGIPKNYESEKKH